MTAEVAARRRHLEGGRRQHRRDELIELPSINRNFIGFIGLLPGIVPSISTESFGSDSISVNGSDPRNNNYLLDGGNNNDDVIGQRAGTQARTRARSRCRSSRSSPTSSTRSSAARPARSSMRSPSPARTSFRGSAFAFAQDADLDRKRTTSRVRTRNLDEARYQAPGVRRHDRRADHPGPDALLREPRARHDRPRRRRSSSRPPGSQLEPDDAGPRVEHARRACDNQSARTTPGASGSCASCRRSATRRSARSARRRSREEDDKDQTSRRACRRCSATRS